MRRAEPNHPPGYLRVIPWPRSPKNLTETDIESGKVKAADESNSLTLGASTATLMVLLAGYSLLRGHPSGGSQLMILGLSGFALIAYCWSSHYLLWNAQGLVLSRPFRKKRMFNWDQTYRISHVPGSYRSLTSLRRLIRLQLPDKVEFDFDMKPAHKPSISFAIALGRHLDESEATELAKPISSLNYSRTVTDRLLVFSLIFLSASGIVFLLVATALYFFAKVHQPLAYVTLAGFVGFVMFPAYLRVMIEKSVGSAWRDNPAFTDPDRPIELLMYDQYGDLAEPLGRFYRHVWANDAKRTRPISRKI